MVCSVGHHQYESNKSMDNWLVSNSFRFSIVNYASHKFWCCLRENIWTISHRGISLKPVLVVMLGSRKARYLFSTKSSDGAQESLYDHVTSVGVTWSTWQPLQDSCVRVVIGSRCGGGTSIVLTQIRLVWFPIFITLDIWGHGDLSWGSLLVHWDCMSRRWRSGLGFFRVIAHWAGNNKKFGIVLYLRSLVSKGGKVERKSISKSGQRYLVQEAFGSWTMSRGGFLNTIPHRERQCKERLGKCSFWTFH